MTYVFPPVVAAVPVHGSDTLFPLRRIYCVGRNYADHAREMGSDPQREPPFFFCKPADAVVPGGGTIAYPPCTDNYQHEVELVVAIGRAARDVTPKQARDAVFGHAIGFDMTRRDLQIALRDKGRPWELGKAFDQSAPMGPIHAVAQIGHVERGAIWLTVNGAERQRGDVSQMIWSVPEVIANLSQYVTLQPGDLIFTGTPAGVSRVRPGDALIGGIEGLGELKVDIGGS